MKKKKKDFNYLDIFILLKLLPSALNALCFLLVHR